MSFKTALFSLRGRFFFHEPTYNPAGRGTNLDREGAHHNLLIPGGALALQLAGYVWDHVVQVPVLQLLDDPFLLVLLGRQSLGAVVAVPVVMLRDRGGIHGCQPFLPFPTRAALRAEPLLSLTWSFCFRSIFRTFSVKKKR